jgi:hypothetical protein
VQERPDYRPINEIVQEGKPPRSSRAPTDPEVGQRVTPVAQQLPKGASVLTVRDALNKCLDEELSRDPRCLRWERRLLSSKALTK